MKSYVGQQRELLKEADKALELMERKLRMSYEQEKVNPTLSLKLAGQAQRHYDEYERVKSQLLASWEEDSPREDVVTVSEDFHKNK